MGRGRALVPEVTALALQLPGGYADARFRARMLRRFPYALADRIESTYARVYESAAASASRVPGELSPIGVANQWIATCSRAMRRAKLEHAFDNWRLKLYARQFATLCAHKGKEWGISFAQNMGATLPRRNGRMRAPAWYLQSAPWWTRQLRRLWVRSSENAIRRATWVHRKADPYVSSDALRAIRTRQARCREFLDASCIVDTATGETLDLFPIAEKSLSNPAIRRAELMTKVRGLEAIAIRDGHVGLFFTLTAPSAFHATKRDATPNPLYNGTSVTEAQAWLRRQWGRARAKLDRAGVLYYGVRVCEPHHDGTPHWHLLLFAPASSADTLCAVLRGYWLAEYGHERGASEHRFKVERIDFARKGRDGRRSGAIGYIAKYIAKNVDGFAVGDPDPDEQTGLPPSDSAERAIAWARTHGLRQFQFIGTPPAGLWRELRRLREPVEVAEVEAVRVPADAGDYAAFVDAFGGIGLRRSPFLRVATELDTDGAMWRLIEITRQDADLPYRAPKPRGVYAITQGGARIVATRTREWVRVAKRNAASAVGAAIESFLTWTRGNNCTPGAPAADASHPPAVGIPSLPAREAPRAPLAGPPTVASRGARESEAGFFLPSTGDPWPATT
ncbi:MAG: replication endonuclease [Hyphomicrobiaceae bacterium]|nr:MAG: replication endonuclease [Hyphomicrobiaceae bacterium]